MPAVAKASAPAIFASFTVHFAEHPVHGTVEPCVVTEIGAAEGLTSLDADSMIDALPAILDQARADAAAQFIDYESFGNDSAYLDRRDDLAEEMIPIGIDLVPESIGLSANAERIRYFLNGNHPDDGGGWSDWAYGLNPQEAIFHGRWMMALNGEDVPGEDIDAHISAMADSTIDYCAPEPVTKTELAEATRDLLIEIGQSTGDAYDKVVEMLRQLDIDLTINAPKM